jgi:hypothetical protein
MGNVILILVLLLVGWFWLDSARAREFAVTLARRYCETRGLQFLDDTVSLARMGLRWTSEGLTLRRMFSFDFSLEGVGRRTGYVLLLGTRLESIEDGLPRSPEEETPAPPTDSGERGKVVPFRPRDRH